jgi:hypothetical protein
MRFISMICGITCLLIALYAYYFQKNIPDATFWMAFSILNYIFATEKD